MSEHTHDFWLTPSGVTVCIVCGVPRFPAPELSPEQLRTVGRFGIHDVDLAAVVEAEIGGES